VLISSTVATHSPIDDTIVETTFISGFAVLIGVEIDVSVGIEAGVFVDVGNGVEVGTAVG
jgi:hypothetical protein